MNKDQTLKGAFRYSCVWCYQRYASKVGDEKHQEYLKKIAYGNFLTGDDVRTFWLNGELKTSVPDQINFLRKVYSEELPVQKSTLKPSSTLYFLRKIAILKYGQKPAGLVKVAGM